MFRYACMTLFLVIGSEIQLSCSTDVFVYDAEKLCLYANLNVTFTVTYEASGKFNSTVKFLLPEVVNASGSVCAKDTSTLNLKFGKGHTWDISFTKENATYNVHDISFTYNLGDDGFFKNASSNETKSVTFNPSISDVAMDTYYSCKSDDTMEKDFVVQTLANVSLQAFIINGSKSDKDTVCARDLPSTAMPTTHAATPASLTTPSPTTAPPPLPTPATGNYSVKNGNDSCLLASMGLRIGFAEGADFRKINIDPGNLKWDGKCSENNSDSTLALQSDQVNLTFTFQEDGKTFRLHALNVTIKGTSGPFTVANGSLSLWQSSLGSSYMCNKEQSYNLTDTFSLHTFSLQVQPFQVKESVFATAEECQADGEMSYIVPIAVGVALGVLIIIVVVVYFIGRRRNQGGGYESF